MRTTRNRWQYTNWDVLVRQIDETEKADRGKREAKERSQKYNNLGENPREKEIIERLDRTANPAVDNSDIRQKALIEQQQRIRKAEQQFQNAWEKEMRSTIEGIREFEGWQEHDKLLAESKRLQQQMTELLK